MKVNSVRLDLVKDGDVVLIVRKGNKPFMVVEKDNRRVTGVWLLTGDEVILDGGEATTLTDDRWIDSLISGLENDKLEIDKRIKFIKSLSIKK